MRIGEWISTLVFCRLGIMPSTLLLICLVIAIRRLRCAGGYNSGLREWENVSDAGSRALAEKLPDTLQKICLSVNVTITDAGAASRQTQTLIKK